MPKSVFKISNEFLLDGKPVKIISGAIHYFRVVQEYWRDRLEKLKFMGCNTVEIYVPWNLHEPEEGTFIFDGICDIIKFIKLAKELDLWVIVRPGPYICAEWEWGGLPYWLLKNENIRVRSTDQNFIRPVKSYFGVLLPLLIPLQIDQGGPIIMMQVENEYGSYGNDNEYMRAIRDIIIELGVTVPLVTSDGDAKYMLQGGYVEGVHPTVNFGSKASLRFDALKQHLRKNLDCDGPLMCMEFWIGWFDYWGKPEHSRTKYEENLIDLEYILDHGNVNFYMFHGGTNFGFMNGSNYMKDLTPDTTSYDYDAPLSEDGQITEKFLQYKSIIDRYADNQNSSLPTNSKKIAYGKFSVSQKVSLFSTLHKISMVKNCQWPLSMEQLGQGYGYTLYRSEITTDDVVSSFALLGANDRAQVFVNQNKELTLFDKELLASYDVMWDIQQPTSIDILMENMGRVNYGPKLNQQRKGICGEVLLNNHIHSGWQHWTLPMDYESLRKIDYSLDYCEGVPAFYQVCFDAEEIADTFLDISGWGKGFVLINDFQLGRFWEVGPQKTLYVPAPLIKKGRNIITIFESEGKVGKDITFTDHHSFL